jgi:uncharacterized protein (TIGR02444 family)
MSQTAQSDNAFWRFSLAVYAAEGVAAECLDLQARHGIDVNLLLFVAWLGASRRRIMSPPDVESARSRVRHWHDEAVRPLRSVRVALKSMGEPGAQDFRAQVKALELEAERIEQGALYALATERWPDMGPDDPRLAARANVMIFLQSHGVSEPGAEAPRLIEAALHNS